jgi:hypothetical protein
VHQAPIKITKPIMMATIATVKTGRAADLAVGAMIQLGNGQKAFRAAKRLADAADAKAFPI